MLLLLLAANTVITMAIIINILNFNSIEQAVPLMSYVSFFRTILYVSIIYAIGNVTVAITSIPAVLARVKT